MVAWRGALLGNFASRCCKLQKKKSEHRPCSCRIFWMSRVPCSTTAVVTQSTWSCSGGRREARSSSTCPDISCPLEHPQPVFPGVNSARSSLVGALTYSEGSAWPSEDAPDDAVGWQREAFGAGAWAHRSSLGGGGGRASWRGVGAVAGGCGDAAAWPPPALLRMGAWRELDQCWWLWGREFSGTPLVKKPCWYAI